MFSQTYGLKVEHWDQFGAKKFYVSSSDFAAFMAEVLPANLPASVVKLPHDFPDSKVSQAVTNQWDQTTIKRLHLKHRGQRARCVAPE